VKILIAVHSPFAMWTIPQSYVDKFRRDFPADTFLHARDEAEALALIGEAEVAFTGHLTSEQLARAQRLRWVHSPAAGVGGMLFPEMLASPVVITNARGLSAESIAEHVLAVTLAMFRRLPHAMRSQMDREWAQDAIGAAGNRMLAGSRVLVVGLGAIGGAVAHVMTILGAKVTGVKRRVDRSAPGAGGVEIVPSDALRDQFPAADVVVIAAPHTAETRNLIGASELARMAPHTILVNVSRGRLVDEAALVDALRAGRIGGAALDVFVDEPLGADSPFWTLPNVLITPHTSGFRPDHWDASTALFADNLRRFASAQPLLNVVDKGAGY
jgi:phosphoglycerate dehydrogenase-like enzyme